MKKSNLKILPAYRMYQAPEGGGEKPLRTSYLKDLSEGSPSRGGGGTRTHPQRQGQIMSGQNMSGVPLLCQGVARWVVALERAGSCPVVNSLHSTRQEPSDGGSIPKPTSETATRLFKVRHRLDGSRKRTGHTVTVIDTVTDRPSGGEVRTRDDVLDDRLGG